MAAAEKELGRQLPSTLRSRLLGDNGGDIRAAGREWQLHPVWDPTDRRTMRKTANNIAVETQAARAFPGFPEGALAIAADGTGDRLVLLPGAEDLVLWDHETRATKALRSVKW
jgi:hypothetical protein